MPVCVRCGQPIRGVSCLTANLERVHWGCKSGPGNAGDRKKKNKWRELKELPREDALEWQKYEPHTWLGPWLESMQLSHHFDKAAVWCELVGALDFEDVKEKWDVFLDYLQVGPLERERLAGVCCDSASASSLQRWATTSSGSKTERSISTSEEALHSWLGPWLDSLQLLRYLDEAFNWCETKGVAEFEDMQECWEEFAGDLRLRSAERSRLAAACRQAGATPEAEEEVLEEEEEEEEEEREEDREEEEAGREDGGSPPRSSRGRGRREAEAESAAPDSPVSQPDCSLESWLRPWLTSLELEHHVEEAAAWCESMGAADLFELMENWEDLAEDLKCTPEERDRLEAACAAEAAGASRGSTVTEAASGTAAAADDQPAPPLRPPCAHHRGHEDLEAFGKEGEAQYRVHELLGRGATAMVYRCSRGGQDYAAKVINLDRLRMQANCEWLLRILDRETSLLLTLRHDKIVQLRDVVETKRHFFLVMELVRGKELFDLVTTKERLTEEEARYIFIQIVDALMYMHSKSIVHRDLKLENILVDLAASRPGRYEVKVSDLGHSKLIRDGYTQAMTHCGTPQYWAPEQQNSGQGAYDERVDLWSLGVVLYIMLVGSFPFDLHDLSRTFSFRGNREVDQLLRGLICVRPEERMSLEQCLQSPWIAGQSLPRPQRSLRDDDHGRREVRIRLPRAPADLPAFRNDLAAWERRHHVPATLQLLEVIVSFDPDHPESVLERARTDLTEIVSRHYPDQAAALKRFDVEEVEASALGWAEERQALEAIYDTEFRAVAKNEWHVRLHEDVVLQVILPPDYPLTRPPVVVLDSPWAERLGAPIEELRACWAPSPGEGCVYQWVERLREALRSTEGLPTTPKRPLTGGEGLLDLDGKEAAAAGSGAAGFTYEPATRCPRGGSGAPRSVQAGQRQREFPATSLLPCHAVPIMHGEPVVEKRSTFVARLARVSTLDQVQWAHRELLSDKKVSTATHNTVAYRFYDQAKAVLVLDWDDDHETGAGKRLATLLKNRGDEGVFLMVSRWYGGVELGADRFKVMNKAAQQLLERAGFQSQKWAAKSARRK